MYIEKMKANSVYPGVVDGLAYCTWDCIAYTIPVSTIILKVQVLLLCTECNLSFEFILIANALHFGTLSLNGEFYFYINIY